MFAYHWLEVLIIGDLGRNGSNSSNPADMTLPVSIGPNRCELIYNHDKQPLLELSLRVCLPVKEPLSVLSQLAPPVEAQVHKPSRSVAKAPPLEDKRKDQPTPPTGHQPIRKSQLPQGSSSSNWQPSYHTWEQNPQPQWEAYPATAMAWQEEWAPSNSQVDEQAQLLWALSDRSVPRYRKPPPAQPKSPKSTAIIPKRAEREVRFALSPEERASPHSSATMAKTAVPLPRKETQKEQEGCPRETPSDEHQPPARPGAHPKKCPVQ